MARPIWSGHISFGLVNIPVQLHGAERRDELHFRLLDGRDHAPVRYQRLNAETGKEVAWKDIVKGFELENGEVVLVHDEDFARAKPEATKTIDIEAFVDRDAIDTVYYDKPYYVTPAKGGEKGWALLRDALERTGKVGVAKLVLRTRQYLAALLPERDGLVLNLLRFAQELRPPADLEIPKRARASDRELALAEQLIAGLSAEWEPESFHDDYRDKLMAWIREKAARGEHEAVPEVPEEAPAARVVDLMSLLKRSVQAQGGGKKPAQRATSRRRVASRRPSTKRRHRVS